MNKILKKIVNKHIKLVVGVIILIIVYSLLSVLSGYSLSFMVNIFDKNSPSIKEVLTVILVIFMIDFSSLIFLYLKYYFQSKLQSNLRNELRYEISNRTINQNYEDFNNKETGTYLAWFTNDVKEIDSRCFEGIFNIIHSVTSVIGTFIAIATFNIWISVATTILSVIMILLPNIMNEKIQKYGEKHTKEEESYISKMKSLIEGFPDLYVSNNEGYFENKLKEFNHKYETNYFQFLIIQLKSAVYSAGLSSFSQLCLLGITMIFVSFGKAPIGSILAMAGLGQVFMGGMSGIVNSVISIKSSNVFFKKYENILSRNPKDFESKDIGKVFNIEVRDVTFSYTENGETINYPSFKVNNLNKILIKGSNGSGKSTLLHLLLGLYKPNSGLIKLDNTNISEIRKEVIFKNIAYLHQFPNLFIDSIRNNIRLNVDVDDSKIWEVLEKVGLVEFVNNLPGKLDYVISDKGKNLSGGQKQRLILARHLLREVNTIILDEATSNIDNISKIYLEKNILTKSNMGVIMIDHSLDSEEEEFFEEVITIK
ncbi:ATP-binding cassette domain-containing protein [Helcococcus kunzii]